MAPLLGSGLQLLLPPRSVILQWTRFCVCVCCPVIPFWKLRSQSLLKEKTSWVAGLVESRKFPFQLYEIWEFQVMEDNMKHQWTHVKAFWVRQLWQSWPSHSIHKSSIRVDMHFFQNHDFKNFSAWTSSFVHGMFWSCRIDGKSCENIFLNLSSMATLQQWMWN